MAKRTVTRVGDVFCVEFDGEYKRFFHYVAKDPHQMESAVIQIFRRRYPIDYEVDAEEIINDEVAGHLHTIVQAGIHLGSWYKVGHSKKINNKALDEVIFGGTMDLKMIQLPDPPYFEMKIVDPLENWTVWQVKSGILNNTALPPEIGSIVIQGSIFPCSAIVEWMRYGYFRRRYESYRMRQRVPWDYVDSYTKIDEGNVVTYYHFHGEEAVREVIVPKDGGEAIRLSTEHPKSQGRELRKAKFWETNWEREDFITEEEFDALWG